MKSAAFDDRVDLARRSVDSLARAAGTVVGTARGLALWSTASGLIAWSALFAWVGSSDGLWWIFVWAIGLLIAVLPATVLTLFWLGLRAVAQLPGRMVETMSEASRQGLQRARDLQSTPANAGRVRRLMSVVRAIIGARAVLFEGRDLLVGGVALARLFNPLALVTVVLSIAASLMLFALAVFAVLVAL